MIHARWRSAFRGAAAVLAGLACSRAAATAAPTVPAAAPTVEQIVAGNAAARGGAEALRNIRSMVWIGHIEAANPQAGAVSFLLEVERPNKTHFELNGMNQRTMRVFDGRAGWKLRPVHDAGAVPRVEPFSPAELKFAREEQVVDGWLIDHEAKGLAVSLDGPDEVEGRPAWRLSLRQASGSLHHLWVDARSFLELKLDHVSQQGSVTVHYRDYKAFGGVQLPTVIETRHGAGGASDRVVIDRLMLNPPLDERVFAKPGVPLRRGPATVDLSAAGGPAAPTRAGP